MQFIKNGPDIPERFLQAHEEGRVVLFCGAGISRPAGLPDFGGLVAMLYDRLGVTPTPVQQEALKARQYDTAIGLLEANYPGCRATTRKELADILARADTSPKATATHESLLTLAKCRNGKLRLITTNFDRLFQTVVERKELTVNTFQAPLLPVPKNHLDGLIYLHGLLPTAPSGQELDNLVVSSGDFGLAYLSERWAARFVSELFRNYTVCFVGYSLNDPVLRYMMDALAADRQRGESPNEMYAFACHSKGKEEACEAEWRAKNVTPILYRRTIDHRYLHKTLLRWSETYRDGVRGKELIIVKEAIASPLISTREDDFVSRVLWALSDASGLPAKRFAELDSVPSLDWLVPVSKDRYFHDDLRRFGVPPKAEPDDKLSFSLVCRPTTYACAPWMAFAHAGTTSSQWDHVMLQMARWLMRHLDDPALVLWLAKCGGQLHASFAQLIDDRLDELTKLEHNGKTEELDRIRHAAPRAIPRLMLRTIWRLLLSGRIKSRGNSFDLHLWKRRFKRDGLTPSLRLTFRELIAPCIELREPFRMGEEASEHEGSQRLKELIDWELKLRANHVHSTIRDIRNSAQWKLVLPNLLPDLGLLLRDAFDMLRELGGADERSDLSYVHQPSISEHPQNRDFHDWTVLIELNRDAWLALAQNSPEDAWLTAQQWHQVPYPLFKRMAFFAGVQGSVIPPQLALGWLLADENWWLWSVETQREALRLLVALSPKLAQAELGRLEEAILTGPPRSMFRDDLSPNEWTRIVHHEVWLRLAKMAATGATLGPKARTVLNELSAKYPKWQLSQDERDEFPFWIGDGDGWRKFVATPRRRRELVEWLKQHPSSDHWQEDDWRQRCRDEFGTTACALYELTRKNVWPVDRWREALQAWAEEKLLKRSWRYMAPVLARAPDEVIVGLAHSLSWWLRVLAKAVESHQDLFFTLCWRALKIGYQDEEETEEPVTRAINHPVGLVAEALLDWWYKQGIEDNQGLPNELLPIFIQLCNPQITAYRHARVLLAAHVIALFRVDPEWTKRNLLPHFDWRTSEAEAKAVWAGFLWSPRLYQPLFELIKPAFLDNARHYAELGRHGKQYAALLTFAALEPRDIFTRSELKSAVEALPQDGRQEAAHALVRALEGAGEQRAEYWRHRILPFWKFIWPKTLDYQTPALSETFARLCIAAGEAFPEAFEVFAPWIQQIEHPDFVVHRLDQEGLAKRYPAQALAFLHTVVGDNAEWPPGDLAKCLEDIKAVETAIAEDERFRRLMDYLRRHL